MEARRCIKRRWPPSALELVDHNRLRLMHPNDQTNPVSHEAIYAAIHAQPCGALMRRLQLDNWFCDPYAPLAAWKQRNTVDRRVSSCPKASVCRTCAGAAQRLSLCPSMAGREKCLDGERLTKRWPKSCLLSLNVLQLTSACPALRCLRR